jgi:eukaryotic-like serine/threonine-protein kinase
LREALGDDSENPRFIETLHRRGYRFIAPVDAVDARAAGQRELATDAKNVRAAIPPSTTSNALRPTKQLPWRTIAGVFGVLLLLAGAGLLVRSRFYPPAATPFQKFTVTRVTNSGNALSGAISPDGRYVASVLEENGMQSLWLRNLPTGSDTQIIRPTTSQYGQLTFSPDGNYIYFRIKQDTNSDSYDLYRCPVLGGSLQLVVRNLHSYAFSPDGQRIAYARLNYPENGKYRILTASLEGENETVWQVASTARQPNFLAWSTKGDQIYSSTFARDEGVAAIDVLDLATGRSHPLATLKNTAICEIQEAPDGRGLFATYWNANRLQLGFLRNFEGDIQPIHQDLSNSCALTLSADGRTLATVYTRSPSTLYVLRRREAFLANRCRFFRSLTIMSIP